jgi:nucleoside-diphosphate-sugar epimerase
MKKVLVTGVTGLVGDGLARYFIDHGYFVYGTSREAVSSWSPQLRIVPLELRSFESIASMKEVIREVDLVIHNAAMVPRISSKIEEGMDVLRANGLAVYQFLKMMEEFSMKKFVYISGARPLSLSFGAFEEDAGYTNIDDYATSKVIGDVICRQFISVGKANAVSLRISAPYGYVLNEAVVPRFIRKAMAGQDITLWGSGLREQVFTFVEDIAYACELALQKDAKGVFNITGGPAISMKELAEAVLEAFSDGGSRIVFEDKKDPQEGGKVFYPLDKAAAVLGYAPRHNIRDGLKKIAAFIGERA